MTLCRTGTGSPQLVRHNYNRSTSWYFRDANRHLGTRRIALNVTLSRKACKEGGRRTRFLNWHFVGDIASCPLVSSFSLAKPSRTGNLRVSHVWPKNLPEETLVKATSATISGINRRTRTKSELLEADMEAARVSHHITFTHLTMNRPPFSQARMMRWPRNYVCNRRPLRLKHA